MLRCDRRQRFIGKAAFWADVECGGARAAELKCN